MNVIKIQMQAYMIFFPRDIDQGTTLQNTKCRSDTNEIRKWLN